VTLAKLKPALMPRPIEWCSGFFLVSCVWLHGGLLAVQGNGGQQEEESGNLYHDFWFSGHYKSQHRFFEADV